MIPLKQRIRLGILDTLKGILSVVGIWNKLFSSVGTGRYFESKQFPWLLDVEENWHDIREEVEDILQYRNALPSMQDISPDQVELSSDPRWKSYPLMMMGERAEQNCRECPKTAALLAQVPGIKNAFFSIMEPGKHIPAHTGPYNGILRWHLGLIIPDTPADIGFRVGGELRRWEAGKSLIFDDTHEHEAWNHSEQQRIILLVDFERPLKRGTRWFNRFLMACIQQTAFAKDLKVNQKKWERLMRQKATQQG